MFLTYHITPREGGPASSEGPKTNVSCHRSTWEMETTPNFQDTSATGHHTTHSLLSTQSCPSEWGEMHTRCWHERHGCGSSRAQAGGERQPPSPGLRAETFGRRRRKVVSATCLTPCVAAAAAAEKAPLPGNWVAGNCERFLPCTVGL